MAEFIVQNLCKDKPQEEGSRLFSDISFKLNEGDILTIKGPSGSGKTTILKCLAELIPFEMGGFTLNNQTPEQLTIPIWRSKVMYVPQRPAILPGSPRDFFEKVHKFSSNKKKELGDPVEIARDWGISTDLWDKEWNTLSGGESQRISMAIALSCHPTVLLLDEPTSALDPKSVGLVENTILSKKHQSICVWITHDPAQSDRVATKTLSLSTTPGKFDLSSAPLDAIVVV